MTPADVRKVLFVCTGNSCRSIMAEAYFKKRMREELHLDSRSAGTMGIDNMPPANNTVEILDREGISADGFASTGLNEDLINWADIVLVMEPAHKESVIGLVPEAAGKTFFLGEFNENADSVIIPDPIGQPLAFYAVSFDMIKKSIEGLIEWLKR